MSLLGAMAMVAVVTASLRIVPGLLWPFRGMDSGAHLLLRRHIRQHGMRLTMQDWPLVLDERHTYPWAYHWLLALLPESWLQRVPPLSSAICDVVHAMVVVLLTDYVALHSGLRVDATSAGLTAGLLFATAPALLVVGFGPRAYEVTPRPFGELLYSVMMSGALVYLIDDRGAGLAVALLSAGMALLASKFAAQVLFFCTPLMAVVVGDIRLLLLLPAAFLVAILLSGGGYWWILRTQVAHLSHYRRRLQFEHPALANRNQGRALLRALTAAVRQPRDRERWRELARLAEGHTLLQFLLRNGLWIAVLSSAALGAMADWAGRGQAWQRWLLAWAAAPLGPFVLTSLKRFRYLGEAERYPEYAIVPVAALAAIGLALMTWSVRGTALAIYALSIAPAFVYTAARLRWNSRRVATADLDHLERYLQTLKPGGVVLALPWHLAFQVAHRVDLRFVAAIDAGVWCRDYDRIFIRYPWLRPDLDRWRKQHGVDAVIVDRASLDAEQAPAYPLASLRRLHTFGRYEAYDWPDGRGATGGSRS
jgi:hypothetical protein